MDGAMGTEVQRAGIREGECYELWNVTHPERVRAIHQAYADAGAEILLTNTFQANRAALARHGLEDQLQTLARCGLDLARAVAGEQRFVLADLGPYDDQPDLLTTRELVEVLRSADAFLLETSTQLENLSSICAGLERTESRGRPVLISFAFRRQPDGSVCTNDGWQPEECARRVSRYRPAALGVNCGRDIGLDEVIEIIRRYRQATDLPLFARPNAGTPTRDGDRWLYPNTPAQMAARLPELLEAGVCMVGGCCGTTPEHLAVFRSVVSGWNARHARSGDQSATAS
jgi:5-methyltetrahydrofolate--homocysteine methyltransferase